MTRWWTLVPYSYTSVRINDELREEPLYVHDVAHNRETVVQDIKAIITTPTRRMFVFSSARVT